MKFDDSLINAADTQDQLIASVAHELKTPLTLISGMASQLQDPDFRASQHPKYLERIQYSSDRLLSLVDSILKGYEIKQNVLELHLEPLSPIMIMEEVAHELEPHARKQAQLITVKSGRRKQPLVLADKSCLHAIIFNLLDNAIKYTKPEQTIELEARLKRDYAQLAVKDYGVGVKKSDVKRIFNQFGKSQRPIPQWANSTGLGLYIAKQLTEAMNGQLELTRRRDGSSFLVNLQLSQQLNLFEV
jgi:signal transduction histidine kinase